MKKQDKISFIISTLDRLYPKVLPPLQHKDPYTLLIAVLLSAQCTDERVNLITPVLFKNADNPKDMCQLEIKDIENIIRPCGLAGSKSKGIYGLSKILVENYNSEVPRSFKDLESFPGVGHKTASVVMAQAFNVPAFPVDTHIHRLMYRWGLSNGKSVKRTEYDAKRLFPKLLWNKLHLQIIYYARSFSPARGWDISNDIIMKKIGRKDLLKKKS